METVQREITQRMRGILVDWLVEVCFLEVFYLNVPIAIYFRVHLTLEIGVSPEISTFVEHLM